MRSMLAFLSVAIVLGTVAIMSGAGPASAEKRMFIIGNNAGSYGVDRCLVTGAECGVAVATSYCRRHRFAKALSFRKVDREEITGGVSAKGPAGCTGAACDFVAIECAR